VPAPQRRGSAAQRVPHPHVVDIVELVNAEQSPMYYMETKNGSGNTVKLASVTAKGNVAAHHGGAVHVS
jgi:hypothetical protein